MAASSKPSSMDTLRAAGITVHERYNPRDILGKLEGKHQHAYGLAENLLKHEKLLPNKKMKAFSREERQRAKQKPNFRFKYDIDEEANPNDPVYSRIAWAFAVAEAAGLITTYEETKWIGFMISVLYNDSGRERIHTHGLREKESTKSKELAFTRSREHQWRYGVKLLRDNCNKTSVNIPFPKPDMYFAFHVDHENTGETEWQNLEYLRQLTAHSKSSSRPRHTYLQPGHLKDFASIGTVTKEIEKELICFPWLVHEWKHAGRKGRASQQDLLCQVARGAAVCLTLLANLTSRGRRPRPKVEKLYPVVAISSTGPKTQVWIAYISSVLDSSYTYELRCIWEGSLSDRIDALEFCSMLDKIYVWVRDKLHPHVGSCLEAWSDFMDDDLTGAVPTESFLAPSLNVLPLQEQLSNPTTPQSSASTDGCEIFSSASQLLTPSTPFTPVNASVKRRRASNDRTLSRVKRSKPNNLNTDTCTLLETPRARTFTYSFPEPDHPYFQEIVSEIIDRIRKRCQALADSLKTICGLDLTDFVDRAQSIGAAQPLKLLRIIIVGDTGVGKSSLISATLNVQGLARSGGNGKAVTQFATEYRYLYTNCSSQFRMEIEYQTESEIRETITAFVQDYQYITKHGLSLCVTDMNELKEWETKKRAALDALRAVFKDHKDIETVLLEEQEEQAVATLINWAQDFHWPSDRNGFWAFEADKITACHAALENAIDPKLWPFVKTSRIFLRSDLLKHGLVLVDLPGLGDSNTARARIARSHLAKADHIFVAAYVHRAAELGHVRDTIFQVLAKSIPEELDGRADDARSLTVICTKAEGLRVNEELADCIRDGSLSQEEADSLRDDICAGDPLASQLQWEDQRRYRLMALRNRRVMATVQDAYRSEIQDTDLKVLCVSSHDFEDGIKKNDAARITASNIPQVQKLCLELVQDELLERARTLIGTVYPNLLEAVEQRTRAPENCEQGTIERLLQLEEQLSGLNIENDHACDVDDLIDEFEKSIHAQSSLWAEVAIAKHQTHLKVLARTYHAFCCNEGELTGRDRWNNDFGHAMRIELKPRLKKYRSKVFKEFEIIKVKGKTSINTLYNEGNDRYNLLRGFLVEARLAYASFREDVNGIWDDFETAFRQRRREKLEQNSTSWISDEMRPVYSKARALYGQNRKDRQIEVICSSLRKTVFPNIATRLCHEIREISDPMVGELNEACKNYLKSLERSLSSARSMASTTAIIREQATPLRAQLEGWQHEAEEFRSKMNRISKEPSPGTSTHPIELYE